MARINKWKQKNMTFIKAIIFLFNIFAWLLSLTTCFIAGETAVGVFLAIGLISFFVCWRISGPIIISRADRFFNTEWEVFKKKLKWSNSSAILTVVILFIIKEAVR